MTETGAQKPAPAPDLVQITVDGKVLKAKKGANLLEVMLAAGIEISYFCYHPGLSVVAVCRQCLVELKGNPKLVPACQTLVMPAMEVVSSSPRVLDARRQMLEFTLENHPIDCPICDKAGECILQRQYMDWDAKPSRLDHPKVHKGKRLDIGPRIVLDQERCILCTRCVRFCSEVVGDPQLLIAERGNHSVLTTAPGRRLDNRYSLNTVDLCPVGALTDKDFRFQVRVWNLSATLSVCHGCATGCLCEIHHVRNRIYRLVPRRVRDTNLNWMCDYGRYTYKAQAADRLGQPRIEGQDASWDDAVALAAGKLGALLDQERQKIGFVLGADVTNEDNFVASRLALDFLGLENVYLAAEPDSAEDDKILRSADPNPNQAGAMACGRGKLKTSHDLARDLTDGKLKALYVVGDVLYLPPPALERAAALHLLAVQAAHPGAVASRAQVLLPARLWEEVDGTITSRHGKVQRLRAAVQAPGLARPHQEILLLLARRMGLALEFASARAVFQAMKEEIPSFSEAEWGKDLPAALLRFAGSRG
jgi:NADH-quinone oxidoreductase subunit G